MVFPLFFFFFKQPYKERLQIPDGWRKNATSWSSSTKAARLITRMPLELEARTSIRINRSVLTTATVAIFTSWRKPPSVLYLSMYTASSSKGQHSLAKPHGKQKRPTACCTSSPFTSTCWTLNHLGTWGEQATTRRNYPQNKWAQIVFGHMRVSCPWTAQSVATNPTVATLPELRLKLTMLRHMSVIHTSMSTQHFAYYCVHNTGNDTIKNN